MAIARKQAVSANANNAALTSTAANDCILVFAYNNASTTIPSLATNYTNLSTNSATGNACRIGYRVSPGAETNTGTWTNATNVACIVYSGCNTTTPFLNTTVGAGNSAILSFTGFTMTITDGSDWIVGFGGAKACTSGINGNTAVLVNQTNQTIITGKDSNGGETSYTTNTLTVTGSGRWLTMTLEIQRGPQTTNSSQSGSLTFAGAIDNFTSRLLGAAASFIGNLSVSRLLLRSLTGTISFIGKVNNFTSKISSGALNYVGSLDNFTQRLLFGGITFIGIIRRSTAAIRTGSLSFIGTIQNRISRALTTTLSFIGAIQTFHSGGGPTTYPQSLAGALTLLGTLPKASQRALSASQSFSGVVLHRIPVFLSALFSFSGSFSVFSSKVLSSAINLSGDIFKSFSYLLIGALDFIGDLQSFLPTTLNVLLESTLNLHGFITRKIPDIVKTSIGSTTMTIKVIVKNIRAVFN